MNSSNLKSMIESINRSSKMMVICGVDGIDVSFETEIDSYEMRQDGIIIYGTNHSEIEIMENYDLEYDPEENSYSFTDEAFTFVIGLA